MIGKSSGQASIKSRSNDLKRSLPSLRQAALLSNTYDKGFALLVFIEYYY